MHPAAWVAALALSVELPLYVGAPLPPAALERALAEADRLFDAGGVRFLWRLPSEEPLVAGPAVVVILPRPARPVISGCRRNLHDHRLGHTHLGARRVTLWTEQVARAVEGSWGGKEAPKVDEIALGTALGRVLAHELGHLFLRLNGHREVGLMKPSFSHRALVGKSDRSFRLAEDDFELVRAAIGRHQAAK
ncbi:MAG: hypothetical protein ACRD3V_23665 [Vicinamibacteria bacterium]